MNGEAMLATAYAIFLIVVAGFLEAVARHSHRRSERMPLAGFRYDSESDSWTCPQEQKLVRAETDFSRRMVVYRAPPHACNACIIKSRCTDSQTGRAIEHAPDSWLESELRRFHRAISLTLFLLAVVIAVFGILHARRGLEQISLAGVLAATVIGGMRLTFAIRRS
jgi:hypothetical protein